MWYSKKAVDLKIRFGLGDLIDRRDDKAYCLLCFVDFDDNDCDGHINSEFHQILMKVTEILRDKEENDLCDSDVLNDIVEKNNTNVGNNQTELCEEAILNSKTESTNSESNDFKSEISQTEEVNAKADINASTSTSKENIDLKHYAKQNNIRYKKENKQAVCELCNVYISANIHNITEHVNGGTHKKMKVKKDKELSKKKSEQDNASYKTIPCLEFFETNGIIKNECGNVAGFLINRKFFIERDSLAFVKEIPYSPFFKCGACDKMVFKFAAQLHLDDYTHEQYMKCPIVDTKNEFIREIKPGTLFHCGFCNEYFSSWSLVQKHLKTFQHSSSRQKSERIVRGILMSDTEPPQIILNMIALMLLLRSSHE